jgi:hypothetical protein
MQKLILSKEEKKKLDAIRKRKLERLKRNFLKKKQNHLNSEKYKQFYEKYIKVEFSDILYEIGFKSNFSIYLYLYLKSVAAFYPDVGISEPIEINFEYIKRISGLCKNTVKKAFWALVDSGMVIFNEDTPVKMRHNLCKSVMIFDDRFLIGFNEIDNQTYYSIKAKI